MDGSRISASGVQIEDHLRASLHDHSTFIETHSVPLRFKVRLLRPVDVKDVIDAVTADGAQ